MSTWLKSVLMLFGGIALLLVVGGCPPEGVSAVYRSPVMLALGAAVALLSLYAAWRIVRGQWGYLLCGVGCLFFACAGVYGVWSFGAQGTEMATTGGPMWFGAAAMVCMALVSLLFAIIFGFLTYKIMKGEHWLAALHLSLPLALGGAYLDYAAEDTAYLRVPVPHDSPINIPATDHRPDFKLQITDFALERHSGGESYSLLTHNQGRWEATASPTRRGDYIELGDERWAVTDLKTAPNLSQPYLLLPGKPPRLLLQNPAPIKEYRATCRFTFRDEHGHDTDAVEETLRVNHPLTHEGWRFYLMSYRALNNGGVEVEILMRRTPGRFLMLIGLIGSILCTAGWCFTPLKSPVHTPS